MAPVLEIPATGSELGTILINDNVNLHNAVINLYIKKKSYRGTRIKLIEWVAPLRVKKKKNKRTRVAQSRVPGTRKTGGNFHRRAHQAFTMRERVIRDHLIIWQFGTGTGSPENARGWPKLSVAGISSSPRRIAFPGRLGWFHHYSRIFVPRPCRLWVTRGGSSRLGGDVTRNYRLIKRESDWLRPWKKWVDEFLCRATFGRYPNQNGSSRRPPLWVTRQRWRQALRNFHVFSRGS